MWKYFVFFNSVIIFLCWCIAVAVITPAYNHFVQYADLAMTLPWITKLAIDFKTLSIALPILWGLISWCIYRKYKNSEVVIQSRVLLYFFITTVCIGLIAIIFYLVGGIQPFLKIGASII
ncbi:MAG: hypothetical protein K8S13_08545 [Desulfobacula sp.]|uniref:hypothetical protein n=1 Tax=Desulfobacula sp. TaxID=2593537 RepID=UPI0025B9B11D|nr:hypothetical protein [Desulfobacula sp.]MCD4719895.1 hypothetical protein [Desulfobacula sp.]